MAILQTLLPSARHGWRAISYWWNLFRPFWDKPLNFDIVTTFGVVVLVHTYKISCISGAGTSKMFPELEHLWLEVPGRNKHCRALVGVIYRSTLILQTTSLLASFESLLSHLTVTRDGMILITGDTNINMFKPDEPLVRHYQDILDTFGLQQNDKPDHARYQKLQFFNRSPCNQLSAELLTLA